MPKCDPTRFLADEDVPVALARAINEVSALKEIDLCWQATSVYDIERTGKSDVEQLIYARSNNMILLTFDGHNGQDGQALRVELRDNGGKIVRLTGGPQQRRHVAIAKLMIRSENWQERLAREDGVAVIAGVSGEVRFQTPEKYASRLAITDAEQLVGYESAPVQPRRSPNRSAMPDGQLPIQPDS